MKKTAIYTVLFFILLFFCGIAHSQADAPSPLEKLPELVRVLSDQGAATQSWQLYGRTIWHDDTSSEFYLRAHQLQKTFRSFQWQGIRSDGGELRLSGSKKLAAIRASETIILFSYPKKNGYETYLIYLVKGRSWDTNKWNTQSSSIRHTIRALFQQKGNFFACVSGNFDGKMNNVSKKMNAILSVFHARIVEKVEEKTFKSVSAYTDHWQDFITSNGRKINVQIGLRTVGQSTTVTVGTPIITTEY
ncbi:YwmB family TATA-box binding protein [Caenibacillus caldisaponilyticus]|uniref:YwmB family TATA-box binding protein n=1 Tax=Caenibacillus caldisaponilyticus TaxID=1674942 RepID=UPI001300E4CE|nr:YwmB family TATA-box binding protein [Caenibacillus caldisaponilyticus]